MLLTKCQHNATVSLATSRSFCRQLEVAMTAWRTANLPTLLLVIRCKNISKKLFTSKNPLPVGFAIILLDTSYRQIHRLVPPSSASESSDLMALYKLVFNFHFNFKDCKIQQKCFVILRHFSFLMGLFFSCSTLYTYL